MSVYVVGLPQTGGCWLSNGMYYTDHKKAYAKCDDDRSKGINSQVFTLHEAKES